VADSVIFTGFRADVPRMLDALDVLCLPSLYEGMPLTAIEAAAMARPVVATAVDGTPEVVRDGRTGRLVPPADPPALARALLDLLRDPDGARRMGQAGRDWALLRFDLDRQVAATARVYRSVAR
jgi:glycosyltransferase involved in cell wall biosynthesis